MNVRRIVWTLVGLFAILVVVLGGCSLGPRNADRAGEGGDGSGTAEPTGRLRLPDFLNPGRATPTGTRTPAATGTRRPTSTHTPTRTHTPEPTPSPTPQPQVNVLIAACDTGFDVFNRLGEVTNAYVRIQNVGEVDISRVEIRLRANDEDREHPDRSYQIQHLPAGSEIALRLTVDTETGTDTRIQVELTSEEGVMESAYRESCSSRRTPRSVLDQLGELFQVRPIE